MEENSSSEELSSEDESSALYRPTSIGHSREACIAA